MVFSVSEANLPPEAWRPLFDEANIEFGYRPLATRAGLTPTRVHRLVRGGGTTDEAIRQVADALGVKESKVRELRGEPAVEIKPFTLPDDAGRLTHNERNVIRAMVRALLEARDGRHVLESASAAGASGKTNQGEEGSSSGDDPQWPSGTDWPTGDDETGMGGGKDAEDG